MYDMKYIFKAVLPLKIVIVLLFTSKACIAKNNNHLLPHNYCNNWLFKQHPLAIVKLDNRLYTATNVLADANTVVFDNAYSNAVDGDDAIKLSVSGESFGILKDNQLLVVEGRPLINSIDTTFFSTVNLTEQNYRLEFVSSNMTLQNITAVLQDNFLGTSTPLNLAGTTTINFLVTAMAASKAVDRFKIVYKPIVLPVKFYSITAINTKNKIGVEWQLEDEDGINEYVVEKSNDGLHFVPVAIVLPRIIRSFRKKYEWIDENIQQQLLYYRIKSIEQSGEEKYSAVVKVKLSYNALTNVWPNPVSGNTINIQLNQTIDGKLSLRLINNVGDIIVQKEYSFINAYQPLFLFTLPNQIIKGKFYIEIRLNNGPKILNTIIKL